MSALRSVGPATLEDLRLLGVADVPALASRDPQALYNDLCRIKGQAVDICCLDVFCCAVAQARNPQLPAEQCDWFWWSRQRKAATSLTNKSKTRP
ncbi:MAG: hypothetical protein F8N36_15275 [Desulfovibrio sp.]|nr:hypothetical protein [Desulfovibrio sp.]